MLFNFFIIISFLKLIYFIDANYNSCPNHNNCVPIRKCSQIYDMIKTGLSVEDREAIINNTCSFRINNGVPEIDVCCPVTLPKPTECGKYCSNLFHQIFSESATNLEEYPWTVLLRKDNDSFDNFICEGSLINKRYLLTAANCVLRINHLTNRQELINITTVRLGEWNIKTDIDCQNEICSDSPVDINVEKIIPHPEFQLEYQSTYHHDIALIRLAKDIEYTNYIQPICLPLGENLKSDLFNDASFGIASWGNRMTNTSSDIKLKSNVDTMDRTKCARMYYRNLGKNLLNSQICINVTKTTVTSKGNYGASLIGLNYKDKFDPRHYLAGIVSLGPVSSNGRSSVPTLYTRVGAYIDWILDNLEY